MACIRSVVTLEGLLYCLTLPQYQIYKNAYPAASNGQKSQLARAVMIQLEQNVPHCIRALSSSNPADRTKFGRFLREIMLIDTDPKEFAQTVKQKNLNNDQRRDFLFLFVHLYGNQDLRNALIEVLDYVNFAYGSRSNKQIIRLAIDSLPEQQRDYSILTTPRRRVIDNLDAGNRDGDDNIDGNVNGNGNDWMEIIEILDDSDDDDDKDDAEISIGETLTCEVVINRKFQHAKQNGYLILSGTMLAVKLCCSIQSIELTRLHSQ